MPSVTYDFVPDQSVFVIDDDTVKSGVVQIVEIIVDTDGTTITYFIVVENETTSREFDEEDVFATCRAAAGYQDAVYLNALDGSPSGTAIDAGSPLVGIPDSSPAVNRLTAEVLIDGTIPITLTHVVVGGETYADLVTEMNTQLGASATASLFENNIRITSATKSSTSSVEIGPGSPVVEDYFRFLNDFTGLAAAVVGLDEGAIETLSDQLCER